MLLKALADADPDEFGKDAANYARARKAFFTHLSSDDRKYLEFQLWQEGIAPYTEIKAAEAAAEYLPSREYATLQDVVAFAEYSKKLKSETLEELRNGAISKEKRLIVYPWGAAEGFLLDRFDPAWKGEYFQHPFTMDFFFEK